MDKLSQLREMRERNAKAGRVRSLVNPRTLPSPQAIKAAADRAQARGMAAVAARTLAGESNNGLIPAVTNQGKEIIFGGGRQQGKTTKMSETAAASEFDKSGYMKLYQRVKRAKTDEDREAAETALRVAFPNKRPRGGKSIVEMNKVVRDLVKQMPKKSNGVSAKARARVLGRAAAKKSKHTPPRKAQRAKKKKGRR